MGILLVTLLVAVSQKMRELLGFLCSRTGFQNRSLQPLGHASGCAGPCRPTNVRSGHLRCRFEVRLNPVGDARTIASVAPARLLCYGRSRTLTRAGRDRFGGPTCRWTAGQAVLRGEDKVVVEAGEGLAHRGLSLLSPRSGLMGGGVYSSPGACAPGYRPVPLRGENEPADSVAHGFS